MLEHALYDGIDDIF